MRRLKFRQVSPCVRLTLGPKMFHLFPFYWNKKRANITLPLPLEHIHWKLPIFIKIILSLLNEYLYFKDLCNYTCGHLKYEIHSLRSNISKPSMGVSSVKKTDLTYLKYMLCFNPWKQVCFTLEINLGHFLSVSSLSGHQGAWDLTEVDLMKNQCFQWNDLVISECS